MTGILHLTDVRLGAAVVSCNDEFFGSAASLVRPEPPTTRPGLYTDHGKWVDGWETRRRREPGHDWAIVRLGVPGLVRKVVVDTSHFSGNQPESCLVEGCGGESPGDEADWFEVTGNVRLEGNTVHELESTCPYRVSLLRISIYPDGGVARLRAYGEPVPAPHDLVAAPVELTDLRLGARVDECSDAHFSDPSHLLRPGPPVSMADGWETRRRRGPGHDWVVVRLAGAGVAQTVEVDTTFFKGNAPAACWLDGRDASDGAWHPLVPPTALRPHVRHHFEVAETAALSHVRLNIEPDGGVARLRVHGSLTPEGAESLGLRWLDTLPARIAQDTFAHVCGSPRWAAEMTGRRPYASAAAVRNSAREVWGGLEAADWLEAFSAHPRIGDTTGAGQSRREQSAVEGADPAVLARIAEGNQEYEKRFGYVFLVRAAGRNADEMLALLTERLDNDPDTELAVAAAEQEQITDLRLARLLGG